MLGTDDLRRDIEHLRTQVEALEPVMRSVRRQLRDLAMSRAGGDPSLFVCIREVEDIWRGMETRADTLASDIDGVLAMFGWPRTQQP